MKAGFIQIPLLVFLFLGATVVGGGGYAVYKVNQIEESSDLRVAELEAKIEEISNNTEESTTQTNPATSSADIATSTDQEKEREEAEDLVEINAAPAQTTQSDSASVPAISTPLATVEVEEADVCPNLLGLQSIVPYGYKSSAGSCIQIEDVCPNVEGIQEDVPTNMTLYKAYGCLTSEDRNRIDDEERAIRNAKEQDEANERECRDAEDELEDAEDEYREYQEILDSWPVGASITQEYQEASIKAVGAANKISILQSSVAAACYNLYYSPTTVDYDSLMPEGPIYTDCRYEGSGYISCVSY